MTPVASPSVSLITSILNAAAEKNVGELEGANVTKRDKLVTQDAESMTGRRRGRVIKPIKEFDHSASSLKRPKVLIASSAVCLERRSKYFFHNNGDHRSRQGLLVIMKTIKRLIACSAHFVNMKVITRFHKQKRKGNYIKDIVDKCGLTFTLILQKIPIIKNNQRKTQQLIQHLQIQDDQHPNYHHKQQPQYQLKKRI